MHHVSEANENEQQEKLNVRATYNFASCDCFSLANVRQCAKKIEQESSSESGQSIDYLVLSQGMATIQGFTPTDEGLDQKLQLHVYSRAAFALHLLPLLQRAEVVCH